MQQTYLYGFHLCHYPCGLIYPVDNTGKCMPPSVTTLSGGAGRIWSPGSVNFMEIPIEH